MFLQKRKILTFLLIFIFLFNIVFVPIKSEAFAPALLLTSPQAITVFNVLVTSGLLLKSTNDLVSLTNKMLEDTNFKEVVTNAITNGTGELKDSFSVSYDFWVSFCERLNRFLNGSEIVTTTYADYTASLPFEFTDRTHKVTVDRHDFYFYTTTKAQYDKWAKYAQENNLYLTRFVVKPVMWLPWSSATFTTFFYNEFLVLTNYAEVSSTTIANETQYTMGIYKMKALFQTGTGKKTYLVNTNDVLEDISGQSERIITNDFIFQNQPTPVFARDTSKLIVTSIPVSDYPVRSADDGLTKPMSVPVSQPISVSLPVSTIPDIPSPTDTSLVDKGFLGGLFDWLSKILNSMLNAINSVLQYFKDLFGLLFGFVTGFFVNLVKSITSALSPFTSSFNDLIDFSWLLNLFSFIGLLIMIIYECVRLVIRVLTVVYTLNSVPLSTAGLNDYALQSIDYFKNFNLMYFNLKIIDLVFIMLNIMFVLFIVRNIRKYARG